LITNKITFIVPYSNEEVLKNWFLKSSLKNYEIIKIPTNKKSAAFQLNKILDNLKKKEWLVFCEERVRLLEDFGPSLEDKSKNFVYGITGALLRKKDKKLEIFDGRTGNKIIDNELVDSVGQGCMIIHSSALEKYDLKFDEDFVDRYMVDFSLQCFSKGMKVAILSLESKFKEKFIPYDKEEFFRDRLRKKYSHLLPIGLFGGILSENSLEDLKSLLNQREEWIQFLLKEKKEFKELSKHALDIEDELKQRDKTIPKLQKELDERSQWAKSLDEQLKQKNHGVSKLQKEFDDRSQWAKSLDEQLKQKSDLESKIIKYEKTIADLINSEKFSGDYTKNQTDSSVNLTKKIYDELETKLVWIFGTPRSGSTWLAFNILKNKEIRSVDETMFGAQLGAFYDNPAFHWALMNGRYKAKPIRIIDRDRDDIFFSTKFEKVWKESLRLLILNRIKAQFGFLRFNHLVLKAPNESHASDILLKCVPHSKLIFLIRDGRDVIDSRQGKFHHPRGLKSKPETPEEKKFRISHFAVMWNLMIETTQKAYDLHDAKLRLMVKYEDLRFSPFKEIDRIYKFLGYDFGEKEINRIVEETKFENIPSELKGEDKNIRKGTPGGYKEYFSAEELKIVNNIMKENLTKYGYKI